MTISIPYVSAFLWIWYLKEPKAKSPRMVARTSAASSHTGKGLNWPATRRASAASAQPLTNQRPRSMTTPVNGLPQSVLSPQHHHEQRDHPERQQQRRHRERFRPVHVPDARLLERPNLL